MNTSNIYIVYITECSVYLKVANIFVPEATKEILTHMNINLI